MPKAETILFDTLDRQGLPFHLAFSSFGPGRQIRAHDHDFYEYFLVRQGRLWHWVNHAARIIKKGDLVFLRPEDTHWFRNPDKGRPAGIVNLALPRDLVVNTARFLWDRAEAVPSAHGTVRLKPADRKVMENRIGSLRTGPREAVTALAETRMLVAHLLELTARPGPADHPPLPGWLDSACQAMRKKENYLQGVTRFVGLSGKTQEHLTRCLRKYLNTTPTEFINRLKAAEAARLLETTDMQVLDAALEAGFNNLSHFINTFRHFYGTTPRQFRRDSVRVFSI